MSSVAPSQLLLESGGSDYLLLEDGSALLREDIRIVAVTAANPRSTTGTTLTITLSAATEAGTDLLISLLNDSGTSIVSVVGNLNAGTLSMFADTNSAHNSAEIRKLSGLTVGTTVLTVTWTGSCSSNGQVIEVEGLDTSPLDQTNLADGVSATVDPGTITPTVASTIVFALNASGTTITGGPTDGYTGIGPVLYTASRQTELAYRVLTAAVATHPTWSQASANWDASIGAAKAATIADDRSATLAVTAGGVEANTARTKGGLRTGTAATAGGVFAKTGVHAGNATLAVTGGGVFAATRTKAVARTLAGTGGGVFATTRTKGALRASTSLTGGGVEANTARIKGAIRTGTLATGGGVVSYTYSLVRNADATLAITGGGVVSSVRVHGGLRAPPITGGGVVSITYVRSVINHDAVVSITGGGVFASTRKKGATHSGSIATGGGIFYGVNTRRGYGPGGKVFPVTQSAVRAKGSTEPHPRIAGALKWLGSGYAGGRSYRSYFKDVVDPIDWDDVIEITAAVLILVTPTDADNKLPFDPDDKAPATLTMLAEDFPDNSEDDFDSYYTSAHENPKVGTVTRALTIRSTPGFHNRYDVREFVRRWAPKTVKINLGTATKPNRVPGMGQANHGVIITKTTAKNFVIASELHDDPDARPRIEITYVGKGVPGLVFLTAPPAIVTQVAGQFFEGDYIPGAPDDHMTDVALQLYPGSVGASLYDDAGTKAIWTYSAAASASDTETGHFVVPLPPVLSSVTGYNWRARARNQLGVWTAWTAPSGLTVLTNAPTLSALSPVNTASYPTLDHVLFGASYSDPDGDQLQSYRIQLRSRTTPSNPDWDSSGLFWDTSDRTPLAGTLGHGRISTEYGGDALPAGDYSWRMRVTDALGAQSIWYYADLTITVGETPDPGDGDFLTGYMTRRARARIIIRGIDMNPQKVTVAGTGGSFTLTYSGETTGAIAYGATATTVKAALEALVGIEQVDVTLVAPGTTHAYTITFLGALAEQGIVKMTADGALLTGPGHAITVNNVGTRGPGRVIADIEDASNIGASENHNAAGEIFFSLPATHPQVSVIEPWQVHYSLQMYRGDGWREITAGLITNFDATDEDVVFNGVDYLGLLALDVDDRFNPSTAADAPAGLYPAAPGGAKYTNKTITQIVQDQIDRAIHQPDSPIGFITRGTIASMVEKINIFSTFKQRLPFIAGLLDSHRGANLGTRTRIRVRKTTAAGYQFIVEENPGTTRDNLELRYGELVQGFRVIPFGDTWSTRLYAMGRAFNSLKLEYLPNVTGVIDEDIWGRIPRVNLWQDITDLADLKRRAAQYMRQASKVGTHLAFALRVDALAVKDGWDITDSIPVKIDRGVVNTENFGSSYYTIWGWEWRLYNDGHSDLHLSVMPRLDEEGPNSDLIDAQPINTSRVWQIEARVPLPEDDPETFVDSTTGFIYQRDPATGDWLLKTDELDGNPRVLGDGTIVDDDFSGALPGGHNVILNSGFELAPFNASVDSTVTHTVAANWSAAHVRTPTNLTEGASALGLTAAPTGGGPPPASASADLVITGGGTMVGIWITAKKRISAGVTGGGRATIVGSSNPANSSLRFTSTITAGATLSGIVNWIATETNGVADHVDMYIDGVLWSAELFTPWGGNLDTSTLSNASHVFRIRMWDSGGLFYEESVTATVNNAVSAAAAGSVWVDTKDNIRVGTSSNNNGNVAIKLKKIGTGVISGVRFQDRDGAGYAAGTRGTWRISIQLDSGGQPSGTMLAQATYAPGTRGANAYFPTVNFSSSTSSIPDGTVFYVVFENIDGNQLSNYFSMNVLYLYNGVTPRQPLWSDSDIAVLTKTTGSWSVYAKRTTNIDVLPGHEGVGYTQCLTQYWQAIGGTATGLNSSNATVTRGSASGNRMRSSFTTAAPLTFTKIAMRVRRDHGSSALTLTVEKSDGTFVVAGTVAAASIPITSSGGDDGGQVIAQATVASTTIPAGSYRIVATAPGDTGYSATPARKAVLDNVSGSNWGSYMVSGIAEYSTNNGGAWSGVYVSVNNQTDLQFALLP